MTKSQWRQPKMERPSEYLCCEFGMLTENKVQQQKRTFLFRGHLTALQLWAKECAENDKIEWSGTKETYNIHI